MKNYAATVSIILCLITSVGIRAAGFRYGGKIGMSRSNIRMADRVTVHIDADKPDIWRHYFTPKIGVNASVFGEYQIGPEFFLRAEPGYILKGAGFSDDASKLSLHYLNLPILVKYQVSDRWGIYAGPEFSTLLKANLDYNGLSIDMKDFYDTGVETSVNVGLEFAATDEFQLGLRYNHGLTKVSETVWYDEAGSVLGAVKEYNDYWLLYAAFAIN